MNNANMPTTSNDSTASPNEPELVTFSASELEALRRAGFSQTDWARVDAMHDDEIDYTDAPELTEEDFANAIPTWGHHRIIVQLDPDVFHFVAREGKHHGRIINEAIRAYMDAKKAREHAAMPRERTPSPAATARKIREKNPSIRTTSTARTTARRTRKTVTP